MTEEQKILFQESPRLHEAKDRLVRAFIHWARTENEVRRELGEDVQFGVISSMAQTAVDDKFYQWLCAWAVEYATNPIYAAEHLPGADL